MSRTFFVLYNVIRVRKIKCLPQKFVQRKHGTTDYLAYVNMVKIILKNMKLNPLYWHSQRVFKINQFHQFNRCKDHLCSEISSSFNFFFEKRFCILKTKEKITFLATYNVYMTRKYHLK